MAKKKLTPEQAELLYNSWDLYEIFDHVSSEEYDLLKENNPDLLDAYIVIRDIAMPLLGSTER